MSRKGLSRRALLKLLGLGSLGLLAEPLLSGCAVDPVTGASEFVTMSPQEEIALDKAQSPFQFSADFGVSQDRGLNGYLSEVGSKLAARSHRPNMPFSFRAVNAAYINAYSFPGGSVAVTRGILVELENEAELAALLGHEIGHVCARHTAERATRGQFMGLLVAAATILTSASGYGSAANLVRQVGGFGASALLATYSRDQEREADALGMEYMTRCGYSPEGMVALMEVLLKNDRQEHGGLELMFASHPMSSERLQTARAEAAGPYHRFISLPLYRERFMDHTARLRHLKPAIVAMRQGSRAMLKKDLDRARELFARAVRLAPDDYGALMMMSQCLARQQELDQARRYARRATAVYPTEAQAHMLLGQIALKKRDYQAALHRFDRYAQLLPGNPGILYLKGRALEGMGRRQEAARQYMGFLRQVRQGPEARYAYTRLRQWGYIR